MAIDCEMDIQIFNQSEEEEPETHGFTVKNPGLVCKVTLVNEKGEIVLDTLVNYLPQRQVKMTENLKKV